MKSPASLRFCVIFVILFCFFLPACSRSSDWVQFRGEGGRGASVSRITPPLGLKWKINLQSTDETIRSLNPPLVIGDTIYFGSYDGNFYALDVESGYMRWVFKSGAEINSIPYADKDKVYFGCKDGKLYALSLESGEEIWNFQTRSQINSLVQRYGDFIVFVGDADAIYFLSPDGEEQYRINNPGWYNFTFIIEDDVMYMATGQSVSQVGPFDIYKKEFLWFLSYYSIDAIWYSFSPIRGNLLFMGTADIYSDVIVLGYHAINRHTGEIVWQKYHDGILNSNFTYNSMWDYFWRNCDILDFMAPAVWRNSIIFTGGDCTARAFEAETGELKWEAVFDLPVSSPPTISGDRVYFGLLGNDYNPPQLVCISARDGRFLWQMEIDGAVLSAPVIAGKRVIFGTDKNVFYVLEEIF